MDAAGRMLKEVLEEVARGDRWFISDEVCNAVNWVLIELKMVLADRKTYHDATNHLQNEVNKQGSLLVEASDLLYKEETKVKQLGDSVTNYEELTAALQEEVNFLKNKLEKVDRSNERRAEELASILDQVQSSIIFCQECDEYQNNN